MSSAPCMLTQSFVPPRMDPACPVKRGPLAQVLQRPGLGEVEAHVPAEPGQKPGSFVPAAAVCYSSLVHRCLAEAAHAC